MLHCACAFDPASRRTYVSVRISMGTIHYITITAILAAALVALWAVSKADSVRLERLPDRSRQRMLIRWPLFVFLYLASFAYGAVSLLALSDPSLRADVWEMCLLSLFL